MFNASWQLVRHLIRQVEWNSVSAPGYLRVGVALGRGAGQFHLAQEIVTNFSCPKTSHLSFLSNPGVKRLFGELSTDHGDVQVCLSGGH